VKCPMTIKVGPLTYRLQRELKDHDNYGSVSFNTQAIRFAAGSGSLEKNLAVLIHEYLHACEENATLPDSDLRLKHDQFRWVSLAIVDFMQQLKMDTKLEIDHLPERAE